jgi:hypothetical protein
MKYRKKPVVVEAIQWWQNGDHPEDYAAPRWGVKQGVSDLVQYSVEQIRSEGWEGAVVRYFRRPDVPGDKPCRTCAGAMHDHGWIDTKEGGHVVCPGDWIITGVQGEYYPCKPDIFAATYEAAADGAAVLTPPLDCRCPEGWYGPHKYPCPHMDDGSAL